MTATFQKIIRSIHRYGLTSMASFSTVSALKIFWYFNRGTDETGYTPPRVYWLYAAADLAFATFFLYLYFDKHMLEVIGEKEEETDN